MKIDELVIELSRDPFNPELNFDVAAEYEKQNQTASAVSFYLRTAEYGETTHPSLVYASLLKVAHCFDDQNDRVATVTNCLLQAVAYLPYRKEAYFLLAQFYERTSQWQEAYTWARMGLAQINTPALPIDVGFHGDYCLLFEKAVSAWWIGRKDESIKLLLSLSEMKDITPSYKTAILHNLERLGVNSRGTIDPLEPVVMNYRKFFGDTASTIIDIGTREGDDAFYLYDKLNGSNVIAIDANPNAVLLAKQTYPWMDIHYAAISDFNGEATFYQVNSENKELAGCSSMASKEKTMFPEHFEGIMNEIKVPARRMDLLLEEVKLNGVVDIVKIDTEGFSGQVLHGFGDRLKDVKLLHVETEREPIHDKHILCEEITKFMKTNGFFLADISYEWGYGIQDQVWVKTNLAVRNRDCFR